MARLTTDPLEPARRLKLDRTLLALHGLADAEGLACWVGRDAVARHLGYDVETFDRYVRKLVEAGEVSIIHRGPGRRVVYVLMEHPGAEKLVAKMIRADRMRRGSDRTPRLRQ